MSTKHQDPVVILVHFDDNYAIYASVMLSSLIDSIKSDANYHIYLSSRSQSAIDTVRRLLKKYSNHNQVFLHAQCLKNLPSHQEFPSIIGKHMVHSFDKVFALDHLSRSFSKILFIDCDILILHDVLELFSLDVGNHVLAARQEVSGAFLSSADPVVKRLMKGITLDNYLNGGLLLINSRLWRLQKITQRCYDIFKECSSLPSYEQDCLAILLQGDFKRMPHEWHPRAQNTLKGNQVSMRYFYNYQVAKLVHFSEIKPDNPSCDHPYRLAWWRARFRLMPLSSSILFTKVTLRRMVHPLILLKDIISILSLLYYYGYRFVRF